MKSSPLRWASLLSLSVLFACGGGSGGDESSASSTTGEAVLVTTSPTADQPAESSAPPAAQTEQLASQLFTTADSDGLLLLANSDFETSFGSTGPGWTVAAAGTPAPLFEAARETSVQNVHTGSAAQRFRVLQRAEGGDAQLAYPYGFVADKTYRVTLQLKAEAPTSAVVRLQRDGSTPEAYASQTVELDTTWREVQIEGTYSGSAAGSVRLALIDTGVNVYVDNVTLHEVLSAPVAPINLPAAGGTATQYTQVVSSGAEGTYTSLAPGWKINHWGSPTPKWSMGKETRPEYVHTGAASQRFQLISKGGGDAHLIYPYAFAKGKKYRAVLYLRSDVEATVEVLLRRDAAPWDPFATKTVVLTPQWQKVELTGSYIGDVSGSLRIAQKTLGATLWVDTMSIDEVAHNAMAPVNTSPIPAQLFGMHFVRFGVHQNWPSLGHGMVRLWNSGTTWRDLEPTNDVWDFNGPHGKRLDMLVDFVQRSDATAGILYTLGQTPQWAAQMPDAESLYGPGASSPPANMDDWRDYVRTLARRYAGRIRHWELWNEPDYAPHYRGTVAEMVEMARIAREELKAADPQNQLVSPGLTASQGMPWLNAFLAAGGGQYVDVIGFHWYFHTSPEKLAAAIDNVRQLMATHGVGDKPLWNTEGAPGCDTLVFSCAAFTPTIEQQRSVMARALMIMWARGVSNHNYYFWETGEPVAKLVESDFLTPTPAAIAYAEMVRWMKGARLIDAYQINDQVYVFRLDRNGAQQVVLWSTVPGTVVNLPSAWAVSTVHTLTGMQVPVPAERQLTLGIEPLLLKP
nr:glycosyl hydrolase [uncultured Caldimonas sp.]